MIGTDRLAKFTHNAQHINFIQKKKNTSTSCFKTDIFFKLWTN